MPAFAPAAVLGRALHAQVVGPALAGVAHAAALLGPGSEVLGYDTERSTDHDWAPAMTVVVPPALLEVATAQVAAALPDTFAGWPLAAGRGGAPARPRVEVVALRPWLLGQLGVDPVAGMDALDWLVVPAQRLLEVVAGPVYTDADGALGRVRTQLGQYPSAVWWWLMAAAWRRLAQEEPFVQRTAEVGDTAGSAVITARQVREVMRLALLQRRRYPPYAKWLGTAFAGLGHRDGLDRALGAALGAGDLPAREAALGAAYTALAARHNALPGAVAVEAGLRAFHTRPALVLDAERLVGACLARVDDPRLTGLPLYGSVDQVADSTDLLTDPAACRRLRALYQPAAPPATAR